MTKEELLAHIEYLKKLATTLDEPDRTLKTVEIRTLENAVDGMSMQDIADKMGSIELPPLEEMDQKIEAARDAAEKEKAKIKTFETIINLVKPVLGLAL